MHRLGVHVERRLLLRFERQHDPQQDVCDAQQPARGQGEHHHDDTDDDRIDVEIIGHARADAAYERLSRTEQPFFTRHASSRSIASTASTHDATAAHSLNLEAVSVERKFLAHLGHRVEHAHEPARDGLVVGRILHRPSKLCGIFDGESPVDHPDVLAFLLDERILSIRLVHDLADDLLYDVLNGN